MQIYQRKVMVDHHINFQGYQYPVPFGIGDVVSVEPIHAQSALRIRLLHAAQPSISASACRLRNHWRTGHIARTYTHSGNSTSADKTLACQSGRAHYDSPRSRPPEHICADKAGSESWAACRQHQPGQPAGRLASNGN